MHYACQFNNIEAVKWLWALGVEVDSADQIGLTPLMFACQNGNLEMVNFLIDNGASVESVFQHTRWRRRGVANYSRRMIHFAAESGNPEVLRLFMNQNIDDLSWDGTPLAIAAKKGHNDACKLLLENKCNPNLPNDFDEYPILLAAQKGNLELLKHLVEHGANINQKNRKNQTPLALALAGNFTDCICYLVDNKANSAVLSDSLIAIAIRMNNPELIYYLAKDPKTLNVKDSEGI